MLVQTLKSPTRKDTVHYLQVQRFTLIRCSLFSTCYYLIACYEANPRTFELLISAGANVRKRKGKYFDRLLLLLFFFWPHFPSNRTRTKELFSIDGSL